MNAVKTEALRYVYSPGLPEETVAVDDISIEIEKGDFVGIIGHTGSGKSTFIQMLNGLLKPQSGRVLIDGTDIFSDKKSLYAARFKVGLVFQYPEYQLFEETVYKDIAFGPRNMKLNEAEVDARVRESARFVGLDDALLEQSPFELSGGQKRRAAIAGVLAMRPEILVLDEPASGLDPQGRAEIFGEIGRYHESTGATVLLVSHSMEDVARYANNVMVINKGKLWDFDSVENIFRRSDELSSMGLAVPQVTQVFQALRRRGFAQLPESVYTVEYAAKVLLPLLGGRK